MEGVGIEGVGLWEGWCVVVCGAGLMAAAAAVVVVCAVVTAWNSVAVATLEVEQVVGEGCV